MAESHILDKKTIQFVVITLALGGGFGAGKYFDTPSTLHTSKDLLRVEDRALENSKEIVRISENLRDQIDRKFASLDDKLEILRKEIQRALIQNASSIDLANPHKKLN